MIQTQHKEQRVGIFVDVQNMYYSAKNLYASKVDFGKVLLTGVAGRKLVRCFAYVIKADVGSEKEFFGALSKIGFEVREKELQTFFGGAKKGDWDVGLCMDVVRLIPKIDVMVLVSGDGDYTDLIEYSRSQGVKTEVIAFGKTCSSKLIDCADMVTDMDKMPSKFLIRTYARGPRRNPSDPANPSSPAAASFDNTEFKGSVDSITPMALPNTNA
jgi:uncharacterized LabA/DUF88 family protein